MKKHILSEIVNGLQSKPYLFKKLKILAVVGVTGILILGTLTIYLGFVGARYIASVGKEVNISEPAEALKTQIKSLPAVAKTDCLAAAQGLLSVDGLLNKPIAVNIQNLKQACFEQSVPPPAKSEESEFM